ncbi:hypothetical protein [Endothiovibrio diazotrophicus]
MITKYSAIIALILVASIGSARGAEPIQLDQFSCGEFSHQKEDEKAGMLFALVLGYGLRAAGVNDLADDELNTLMGTATDRCKMSQDVPLYQVIRENIRRCGNNDSKERACAIPTDSSAIEVIAEGAGFYWYKYDAKSGKKYQATYKTDGPLIWAGEGAFNTRIPAKCSAGQGLATIGAMAKRTRSWENRPKGGEKRYIVVCADKGVPARITISLQELPL